MSDTEQDHFSVVFYGKNEDDHTVDAGALGRSLAAFDDLIHSMRQVNDAILRQPAPTLRVEATDKGSFDLGLLIDAWHVVRDVLNSVDAQAAGNLVNWGVFVWNVIDGIRKHRGREIKKVTQDPGKGTATHELDDGDLLVMDADVSVAIRTPAVRKAASKVVAPASRSDVTRIEFRSPARTTIVITSDEVPAFTELSVADDEMEPTTYTTTVQPVNVSFEEDGRWKVSDGTSKFMVTIEDEDFLRKVDRHEVVIGKGDMFEVVIRSDPYRDQKNKLHARKAVTHVRSHRPPSSDQDELPI